VRPIGILGGTFDPVHNAHLAMARAALARLGLEKVLFIPTGAPKYRAPAVASPEHRVAMLRLALAGDSRCAIDERELVPGHSGYTVDTLATLHRDLPDSRFFLLMGADQYAKLGAWHRPEDLPRLCTAAVFARPGHRIPDSPAMTVPFEMHDISASDIRARIGRGEDVSAMVPPAVLAYIERHRLYGHP
jgi:nicotinate-nucleotide adenylyltransferase